MFTESQKDYIKFKKHFLVEDTKTYRKHYPELPWDHMFVAGGAFPSLLRGERINDYDFYCRTAFSAQKVKSIISELYRDHIKDYDEKYKSLGVGKVITKNAITMKDGAQFIFSVSGEPEDVKKSFDYLHCCTHFDLCNDTLYVSKNQYDSIMSKHLVLANPTRVQPAAWRTDKFVKRGWTK